MNMIFLISCFIQVDDWESEGAFELYDQEDVEWDGQYSSGRKRPLHDAVAIDIDSFARRPRKPRFESREEVNQRMLSVERAVRDALIAKGEINFTDQEFPPDDQSLFVDPMNPPLKLQVWHIHVLSICVNIFIKSLTYISLFMGLRLYLSG
jgi:hypothetical protein